MSSGFTIHGYEKLLAEDGKRFGVIFCKKAFKSVAELCLNEFFAHMDLVFVTCRVQIIACCSGGFQYSQTARINKEIWKLEKRVNH